MEIYTIDTDRYNQTLPTEPLTQDELMKDIIRYWSDFMWEVLNLEPNDEDSNPFMDFIAYVSSRLEDYSTLDSRVTPGVITVVDKALGDFIRASSAYVVSLDLQISTEEKVTFEKDLLEKHEALKMLLDKYLHLILPPEI